MVEADVAALTLPETSRRDRAVRPVRHRVKSHRRVPLSALSPAASAEGPWPTRRVQPHFVLFGTFGATPLEAGVDPLVDRRAGLALIALRSTRTDRTCRCPDRLALRRVHLRRRPRPNVAR